jgi:hypothetical protein
MTIDHASIESMTLAHAQPGSDSGQAVGRSFRDDLCHTERHVYGIGTDVGKRL